MAYAPTVIDLDEDIEREPLMRAELDSVSVYPFIHLIKGDIQHFIDTPLSYEALTSPELTYSLVQPLYDRYSAPRNMSVVFCCLITRVHFLRDRNLSTQPISQSRAALCEILAIRLLQDWAENTMDLATVMTTSWLVFSGADELALKKAAEEKDDLDIRERVGNAIEIAIVGQAKRFIKSAASQKVIDSIWSGRIVYQAESDHAILSDTYKRTPTHFYDPHKAPLLDHYRLKVPAIRSILEYMTFVTLFILYVVALEGNQLDRVNWAEGIFIIYASGFTLDKIAAVQEHGMKVYSANLWNAFDIAFITIFMSYVSLRWYGLHYDEAWAMNMGIDILAMGACLMFPRLAFVTLSNNLMILSLRSMFVEFFLLMLLAAFCFLGFLYALWTLSRASNAEESYSAGTITWWMLDLYFGLDASGFDKASNFHPYFGPLLMIVYACLSNTLLLTVLVSILSHTFSTISSDAYAESLFRRAATTIEGVKADALFSYQPPLNLFAFIIMLPLSYILDRRWFHKVNVFMIRTTAFPVLLGISFYERQKAKHKTITVSETVTSVAERMMETLPRRLKRLTFFEGITGSGSDIDAVFEVEEECLLEDRVRRVNAAEQLARKRDAPDTPKTAPASLSHVPLSPKDKDKDNNRAPIPFPYAPDSPTLPKTFSNRNSLTESPQSIITSPTQPLSIVKLSEGSPLQRLRNRRESNRLLLERERRLSGGAMERPAFTSSLSSPLAQLFQPVVFEDEAEPSLNDFMIDGSSTTGGLASRASSSSFDLPRGPLQAGQAAVARRLTAARNRRSWGGDQDPSAYLRRRTQSALMATDRPGIRPSLLSTVVGNDALTMGRPASTVPEEESVVGSYSDDVDGSDNEGGSRTMRRPAKASSIQARDDDDGGADPALARRLEEMERRQRRMEEMLMSITMHLGAQTPPSVQD